MGNVAFSLYLIYRVKNVLDVQLNNTTVNIVLTTCDVST